MVGMDFSNNKGWTEGTYTVLYFYVGQGDCMLVKCPGGETIMVDCGTTGGTIPEDIGVIRSQLSALCDDLVLDFLILTHPDRDHYALVPTVLEGFTITNLIISCATKSGAPLGFYRANSLNNRFYNGKYKTKKITEVTIREKPNSDGEVEAFARIWTNKDLFKSAVKETLESQKYTVTQASEDSETDYEVAIIAGNVLANRAKNNLWTQDNNSSSLVTVFALGDKIITSWGDATAITESFVLKYQQGYIKNAEISNISHHGSAGTNLNEFVTVLNTKYAVVSVELGEHSYYLPNNAAIQKYVAAQAMEDTTILHPLDGWELAADYKKGVGDNEATRELARWNREGITYTSYNLRGTPRFEMDPLPDNDDEEPFYYMLVPAKGKMLKRQYITKATRQVGIEATSLPFLYYTLSND